MMNQVLFEYNGRFCLVYLDDILIFSDTLEEHAEHLAKVLQRLKDHELYAKPSKCVFASESLEFVGHIVGGGEVRPVPAKVQAIKDWPRPKSARDLRQFLGLASFYRRYVKGFARLAAPLSELLRESDPDVRRKKTRPIVWNVSCQLAFDALKEALSSEPVLIQPDPQAPFTLETDASDWAVGVVLLQLGSDGRLHPVAYEGRKLQGAELNYPVHEKELLAIKYGLEKFHYYIDNGQTTTIVTDHESLQYLQTTRRPSRRLARWVASFQQYDLVIKYRPGKDAVVPDAISRRPDFMEDTPGNVLKQPLRLNAIAGVDELEWLDALKTYLQSQTLPINPSLAEHIQRTASDYIVREQDSDLVLYRVFKDDSYEAPYLAPEFRQDLLRHVHQEFGHLGNPGLMGVLRPRAFWPGMEKDVQEFVHNCPQCQVSQRSRPGLERERAHPLVDAKIRPFERWGLDLIGRLPTTPNGNRWIITAIEYVTGWPVARALKEATEEEIARFIHEEIYTNYGAPREIISDNGPNLIGAGVAHYVKQLATRHRTTTPYHPRTNGKVENLNGLIGRMLTKYLVGKPTRLWDEYLHQALFAARIRIHTVTKKSPFYLLYGLSPRIPSDPNTPIPDDAEPEDPEERLKNVAHVRTLANELLLNRAIRTKRIHDEAVKETSLQPGTWVLVRNEGPEKFQPRWFGPYRILKAHPLGTYALEEPSGRVLQNLINGSRLIEANVSDPEDLWSSSAQNAALKRKGLTIERPIEVRTIVDAYEPDPISYRDLSTITKAEWERRERSGEHSGKVGEGDSIAERILARRRGRKVVGFDGLPADRVARGTELQEQSPDEYEYQYGPDSTASDTSSVAELSQGDEDPMEDVSVDVRDRPNAQKSDFMDFEGSFAVVI
jgi:transposase InsO family protein